MKKWWKEAVIYQIYPRSFYDSNNDGIGDINGIIEKLDYVKDLGIDVIWLSPVYKSPNDDNGYDISDYEDIMDEFGTLKDWEKMLDEIHKRGMKLIMDLVVNHTSDEHEWFVESKKSKDNPKRDYYIWRDAKKGKEPNNWETFFSEPAWEYDKNTDQYYLHLFTKKQPDLNWDNPKVVDDVFSMIKWWLDKGIDGFRMDVINLIAKPDGLENSSLMGDDSEGFIFDPELYANNEKCHEYLHAMKTKVLSNYDVMTVGETPVVTPEIALKFVDEKRDELDMVFNFEHVEDDGTVVPEGRLKVFGFLIKEGAKMLFAGNRKFDVPKFKDLVKRWYTVIEHGGWNSQYFSNHDQPRHVSKFGDDKKYHKRSAKMMATLIHTLPGTPYVYQGEEIGMTNISLPAIDDYKDVASINGYKKAIAAGIPKSIAMMVLREKSRDNARTPMQWSNEENAGFTNGNPWLTVNPNYEYINAKAQQDDKTSVLSYYKDLIALRKQNEVMVYGDFKMLDEDNNKSITFTREYEDKKWLVTINLTNKKSRVKLHNDIGLSNARILLSSMDNDGVDLCKNIMLSPYEAMIIKLA